MNFIKTPNSEVINNFRKELYKSFTAPLDSMWQDLYIASSQLYLIKNNNNYIGYCCIDTNNYLVQLFVNTENKFLVKSVVKELIKTKHITSASLSSIEPVSFNACLFYSKSIKASTFCYEHTSTISNDEESLNMVLASEANANEIRTFYKNHVGFEDTFGYVNNLIARKELYLVKNANTIISTGECRLSDTQLTYADVGVAVNKEHRKKGFATKMLQQLAKNALIKNRKPICSTTIDNIGSQKAIEKAGFYCSNIIFEMEFKTD